MIHRSVNWWHFIGTLENALHLILYSFEISINSGVPAPALALTPNPRWRKLVRSCTENWRSMRRWQKRSCMRRLWIRFLTPLQNIESMEEGFTNTYSDWLSKAGKIWWENWTQMQLLIPTLPFLMAVDTWKRGCLSSSPIIFSLVKSFKNVLESRKEGMYHLPALSSCKWSPMKTVAILESSTTSLVIATLMWTQTPGNSLKTRTRYLSNSDIP